MKIDVKIPEDFWEQEQEGVLGTWLYADGEMVQAGAVICEVMTEKVAHEVESPATGKLTHLVAEEDEIVQGQVIASIET